MTIARGPARARTLTIVMYHYVRRLEGSAYPRLKALTVDRFEYQLDHIARRYQVIDMETLLEAATGGGDLPGDALLLTFDDGFADHYETVLPALEKRGMRGAFFASSGPAETGRALDVHKIQFILAAESDPARLFGELLERLRAAGHAELAAGGEALAAGYADDSRFDGPEVTAFKRLLQRDLPRPLRGELVDGFFRECVTDDERAFCRDLYLSEARMIEMRARGMFFGSHGHEHVWLDRSDAATRRREVDRSLAMLERIGESLDRWVMCYPYGGTSAAVRDEIRTRGCAVGFLAEPGVADLDAHDPRALPRLDTNDLPQGDPAPR